MKSSVPVTMSQCSWSQKKAVYWDE